MDESASDAVSPATGTDLVHQVDGIEVASFRAVIARLRTDYPLEDPSRIEAVVLREWEAFSAGRPLVVPIAVEEGAREVLGLPRD